MTAPDVVVDGRYRLVRRLASGGMGIVWEAWDNLLQRPVALKQLQTQSGLSTAEAELAANRAMREARITARLHHGNAVPVYDVVEHDGKPCLIMQYLPSTSLQTALEQMGRLPVGEVARIGADVAAALAAAHKVGIVHRDVKPGNVLIADDGTVKITDFGISHALGDITLTSTGMVTGTPAYLAPEVARGIEAGFASDVFSLGSTLYAALEGTPPFGADENPMAVLHRVASGRVIPPTRSGALTPLLQRMLAADPVDRPPMTDVAHALAELRAGTAGSVSRATTERLRPSALADHATSSMTAALPPVARTGDGAPARPAVPPDPPEDRRPSRRGALAILAGTVVALTVLTLAAVLLLRPDKNRKTGSSTTQQQSQIPASTSTSLSTSASSPSPRTTPRTTRKRASGSSSTAPSRPAGVVTAGELAQAIVDYYQLLPTNTDAAWARLTAHFQNTRAGGRQSFEAYWATISRITVSGATGSPPGTARAVLTYYYKDGRVITEPTSFRLVRAGGVLEIDGQS